MDDEMVAQKEVAVAGAADQPEGAVTDQVWQSLVAADKPVARLWGLFLAISGRGMFRGADKVGGLRATAFARRIGAILAPLDAQTLAYLNALASINHQRAAQDFRIFLVANLTAPLLLITVLHEVSDGALLRASHDLMGTNFYLFLGVFLLMAIFLLMVPYCALSLAADLDQLISLHRARRMQSEIVPDASCDDPAIEAESEGMGSEGMGSEGAGSGDVGAKDAHIGMPGL